MARAGKGRGVGSRRERAQDVERTEHWRGLVRAWEGSGLTQVDFCRRKGVSVHTFRSWRYSLRLQAKEERRAPASRALAPPFGEVKLAEKARLAGAGVAVELGDGRVVRVEPGFDPATLKEVLAVLGSSAC